MTKKQEVKLFNIPVVDSVSPITKRYETGEQPVLVSCSDGQRYVCKFNLSQGRCNKLVCELIGSLLAKSFGLHVPSSAIVLISKEHLYNADLRYLSDKVCIGSKFIESAVDVTKISLFAFEDDKSLLDQLILVALFDLWIANEDRNFNNYNLMFDIEESNFVAIDFGCIFNTSTFELPLSQLTYTDSILYSELFKGLSKSIVQYAYAEYEQIFREKVAFCEQQGSIDEILCAIPKEWDADIQIIRQKLEELFSDSWIDQTWENFKEIITDVLENE